VVLLDYKTVSSIALLIAAIGLLLIGVAALLAVSGHPIRIEYSGGVAHF
jgi:hypothetical protein